MSKFKSSIAMMVAGGAIGAAGHASAATIPYDYSSFGSGGAAHNVNILGVDEYSYGPNGIKSDFTPLAPSALTGTYSQTPTPESTDTYSTASIKTNGPAGPAITGDSYLNLSFDANGAAYLGAAKFTTVTDPAGGPTDVVLDSITYQPAGAVPEPDAWLLLAGGMGLAGAALRRKRDQAAVAA